MLAFCESHYEALRDILSDEGGDHESDALFPGKNDDDYFI